MNNINVHMTHPADNREKIETMKLALALRDYPVARVVAHEILSEREAYDKAHPILRVGLVLA